VAKGKGTLQLVPTLPLLPLLLRLLLPHQISNLTLTPLGSARVCATKAAPTVTLLSGLNVFRHCRCGVGWGRQGQRARTGLAAADRFIPPFPQCTACSRPHLHDAALAHAAVAK
jgi:hypothetical protein